jgi:DNA invertase Pin-like site-specific DNA recombinase
MVRPAQPVFAVAYFRVSTQEQGQSGLGMESQEATVAAFAASRGWRVVARFYDVASGKSDRRPGFQAALAECRRMGAFLVAAKLDRISRRAHTLSALLEEGIRLRTADMPDADDFMLRVYAAMAQRERELISERTKAALGAAKARGKRLGGDRGHRPTTTPDVALATAGRLRKAARAACRAAPEIAELRATGATSLRQLAAGLNARGLTTPRGKAWDATAVKRAIERACTVAQTSITCV